MSSPSSPEEKPQGRAELRFDNVPDVIPPTPLSPGEDPEKAASLGTSPSRIQSTGSSANGEGALLSADFQRVEKRLVRKLDVVILPITLLLYLSASLDRSNLGNARLQGLQADVLSNSSIKFDICLAAFYIAYIVFNPLGNVCAKLLPPQKVIAAAAFIWGLAATLQAVSFNFPAVVVCRLFIGIGEAGFGPTVPLYYTLFYRKSEIAVRFAFFIGMGSLAGAFGGVIAFAVQQIRGSLATWRILFLIEGLPTVAAAILLWFLLPGRPEKTKYLNETERTVALTRLNAEGPREAPRSISKLGVKRAATNWRNYMLCGMYMGINLTLGSISGFLPTIVKTLGYSNANAQLYTVPPYAVATAVAIAVCHISDRFKVRGPFVAALSTFSIIGFSILIGDHHNQHVRYFAVFLVVFGTFTCIPLTMAWMANNAGTESSRAVGLAMLNVFGQCFAILASFIFPSNEGPYYKKGLILNLVFTCTTVLLAVSLSTSLYLENKRRDRKEGGRPQTQTGLNTAEDEDKAEGFRYMP